MGLVVGFICGMQWTIFLFCLGPFGVLIWFDLHCDMLVEWVVKDCDWGLRNLRQDRSFLGLISCEIGSGIKLGLGFEWV